MGRKPTTGSSKKPEESEEVIRLEERIAELEKNEKNRIHKKSVIAFVNEIEKAHQYFALKDKLKRDRTVKFNSSKDDLVKKLERRAAFDMLGTKDIYYAVHAHIYELYQQMEYEQRTDYLPQLKEMEVVNWDGTITDEDVKRMESHIKCGTLFRVTRSAWELCHGPSLLYGACGAKTPSSMPSQLTLRRTRDTLHEGLVSRPYHLPPEMRGILISVRSGNKLAHNANYVRDVLPVDVETSWPTRCLYRVRLTRCSPSVGLSFMFYCRGSTVFSSVISYQSCLHVTGCPKCTFVERGLYPEYSVIFQDRESSEEALDPS